jgi:hypothetical protein
MKVVNQQLGEHDVYIMSHLQKTKGMGKEYKEQQGTGGIL